MMDEVQARLEQIEARANAASEAPWEAHLTVYRDALTFRTAGAERRVIVAERLLPFINHSQRDVPWLLDLVKEPHVGWMWHGFKRGAQEVETRIRRALAAVEPDQERS